jgi:hypothetical protein
VECKLKDSMDRDIKAIILLLATQSMINLGEIRDPLTNESKFDLEGATVFLELLDVLETKTRGNLTEQETTFLADIRHNLDQLYNKKLNQASG